MRRASLDRRASRSSICAAAALARRRRAPPRGDARAAPRRAPSARALRRGGRARPRRAPPADLGEVRGFAYYTGMIFHALRAGAGRGDRRGRPLRRAARALRRADAGGRLRARSRRARVGARAPQGAPAATRARERVRRRRRTNARKRARAARRRRRMRVSAPNARRRRRGIRDARGATRRSSAGTKRERLMPGGRHRRSAVGRRREREDRRPLHRARATSSCATRADRTPGTRSSSGSEKIVVRLVPSGILRKQTTCVLAQGMVIDPVRLVGEIDELEKRGLTRERARSSSPIARTRSCRTTSHRRPARATASGAIGTTKRGVGPCYEDKAARRGVPLGALRDLKKLRRSSSRRRSTPGRPSSARSAARRRRSTR